MRCFPVEDTRPARASWDGNQSSLPTMSPETANKISTFLENTLPDGHGYALFIAAGTNREETREGTVTLLTNVSPASVKRTVSQVLDQVGTDD